MRHLAFLFIIALVLLALYQDAHAESTSKVVQFKDTYIDNEFSAAEFFLGNGSITKSQTNYLLIAEDGTTCEVTRQVFYRVRSGQLHNCWWH